MLIGDERVNIYVGGKTLGTVIKGGYLSSFELQAVPNPSIEIWVNDYAAERLENRTMGLIPALENGDMTVRTYGFFTGMKVGLVKNLYILSGGDDILLRKKK